MSLIFSDWKQVVGSSSYSTEILATNNYYPFGMLMPGYTNAKIGGTYRYGYNDKEKDDDIKGVGNSYDYGMRMYDSRLGRFLSLDPLATKFIPWSPYAYAMNSPIYAIDLDGLEKYIVIFRTFIPYPKIDNPLRIMPGSPKYFGGDSREYYDINAKTYRTEQKVLIDFDNSKITVLNNASSASKGLDPKGNVIETSDPDVAGPQPQGSIIEIRGVDNSKQLQSAGLYFKIDAGNKLAPGSPTIDAKFQLFITPKSDGSFNFSLTGTTDGFPAYEFWVMDYNNKKTDRSYLIFNQNPIEANQTPYSLFGSGEFEYSIFGNSNNGTQAPQGPVIPFENVPNSPEKK